MQQDNDPTHTSKSCLGMAESESWPYPNSDAVAWPEEGCSIKKAQYIDELKRFSSEKRSQIPPRHCARRLPPVEEGLQVTQFKGSLTFSNLYCEWLLNVFSKDVKSSCTRKMPDSTFLRVWHVMQNEQKFQKT